MRSMWASSAAGVEAFMVCSSRDRMHVVVVWTYVRLQRYTIGSQHIAHDPSHSSLIRMRPHHSPARILSAISANLPITSSSLSLPGVLIFSAAGNKAASSISQNRP